MWMLRLLLPPLMWRRGWRTAPLVLPALSTVNTGTLAPKVQRTSDLGSPMRTARARRADVVCKRRLQTRTLDQKTPRSEPLAPAGAGAIQSRCNRATRRLFSQLLGRADGRAGSAVCGLRVQRAEPGIRQQSDGRSVATGGRSSLPSVAHSLRQTPIFRSLPRLTRVRSTGVRTASRQQVVRSRFNFFSFYFNCS